jgi:hypothetical protein
MRQTLKDSLCERVCALNAAHQFFSKSSYSKICFNLQDTTFIKKRKKILGEENLRFFSSSFTILTRGLDKFRRIRMRSETEKNLFN